MLDGYKKVGQRGGTYIVAEFWNPETDEIETVCVRDYDYADGCKDNDELYYMPIDEEAKREMLHRRGVIQEGDRVVVTKGRKFSIGAEFTVRKIFPYRDRYGRWIADYAYFEEGGKCNVDNLTLA